MATISASPAAGVGIRVGLDRPVRPRRITPITQPDVAESTPIDLAPVAGAWKEQLAALHPRVLRMIVAGVAVFAVSLLISAFGVQIGRAVAGTPSVPTAAPVAETAAYPAYTVAPGDTLWSISQAVNPQADPRATVMQLRVMNGLGAGHVLQPGQVLQVPSRIAPQG